MLTPREFDQIQIALFGMAKTKINGIVYADYSHVLALIKSYTEGELTVTRDGDDGLNIGFAPAEEKQ
jgi:hypothetical protein